MAPQVDTNATDLFVTIYRSFLKDGGSLRIEQILTPYQAMRPALHPGAVTSEIDFPAFLYSSLRLPPEIATHPHIILAQSDEMLLREGYKIKSWKETTATARRRKMLVGPEGKLAVFINSVTDVDDIVCLLTAYQIEYEKIHERLLTYHGSFDDSDSLRAHLGVSDEIWLKFQKIWRNTAASHWQQIADQTFACHIDLLRGSYVDYKKSAQSWFFHIRDNTPLSRIGRERVYFVSSNTHSVVNSVTGFVNEHKKDLISFMQKRNMHEYLSYWKNIGNGTHPGSEENFLWYILKKYEREYPTVTKKRIAYEQERGISYVEANHFLDINAQVIELSALARRTDLSESLGIDTAKLRHSPSYILNIDYPLGLGAYMVLSTVLRNIQQVRGVYVLGKASFLNGNLGDVAIPSIVYDEFSKNVFVLKNAITPDYLQNFKSGNVLNDQHLISVRGTLLHPEEVIREYFQKGYTVIEMENGSYLNAVSEVSSYARYAQEKTINLVNSPIDIGIINYASDTPFTKAVTLATRNLGYEGVEATYESSRAILRRIAEVELSHI